MKRTIYHLSLDKADMLHLYDVVQIAAKRRHVSLRSYVLEAFRILVTHDAQTDKVVYAALYNPRTPIDQQPALQKLRQARRKERRRVRTPKRTWADRHPLRPLRENAGATGRREEGKTGGQSRWVGAWGEGRRGASIVGVDALPDDPF